MLLLSFLWAFQQITIKIANTGVSPILQAGIRSIVAAVALSIWMLWRCIRPIQKDGTLLIGIAAGILFALEFVLIYWGLTFTNASRSIIFIYSAPFVVALGIHWFIPNEELNRVQLAGLVLAFTGIIIAFGEGFTVLDGREWIGDSMCLLAALAWGATTVLVRASKLSSIEPVSVSILRSIASAL